MKKLFLSLLVALCGAVSLHADEVAGFAEAAEVKAVIVRELELVEKGDFAGVLALYAPDYRQVSRTGENFNYEQLKWLLLALDGKHPEEFWLFGFSAMYDGAMPSAEERAKARAIAQTPKGIETYEKTLPQLVAAGKEEAALERRTLKFVSVKVDGDAAVAVIEYDRKGENGAIKTEIGTINLRRIGGDWKFYRCVYKDK